MKTDKPYVVAQLSDPHLGATWVAADPLMRLRACVDLIRRSTVAPDVVIVSGDLVDNGSPDEYAVVQQELARLELPVRVVPGNHDDRGTLRVVFGLPGDGDAPVHYAEDAGPLRLVMLDSTVPGADHGDLDRDQLDWLESTLGEEPERPTILVMHHPPLRTGIPVFDSLGLEERALAQLARILERNDQVLAALSGHLHRTVAGTVGGRTSLTIPSTYVQSRLDFAATEFSLAEEEPPALAIHTLLDGRLTSHVQVVI